MYEPNERKTIQVGGDREAGRARLWRDGLACGGMVRLRRNGSPAAGWLAGAGGSAVDPGAATGYGPPRDADWCTAGAV